MKVALLLCALIASSTFELVNGKCNATNPCQDPLGSVCVDGVCFCRDENPHSQSRLCLDFVYNIGEPCWVSSQCALDKSACLRPSGRTLTIILEPLWEAFLKTNASHRYIPGTCRCMKGFRETNLPDGNGHVCSLRAMGSECRTHYQCAIRSKFTQCLQKRCVCATGFIYDYAADQCIKDSGVECGNEFCTPNQSAILLFKETFANLIGFTASMGFMAAVWLCCWKCNGSTSHERPQVASFEFSALRHTAHTRLDMPVVENDGLPEYESEVDMEFDASPPTYDEAIQRLSLAGKRTHDQVLNNSC